MLQIERSSQGNIVIVAIDGRVDDASAERLGTYLRDELETGGRHLVLDLQRADLVGLDSQWELLTALKRARRRQGGMRLAQPSDKTRDALAASGLDELFQIYESVADAVGSF